MVSRRSNNVERTEWNKRCREQLSGHIYNRLGIFVEASQVQLKTNPNDPYAWEKMDEKEHLFSKNLSDLSTRQLKELCEGVDKSFVAIRGAPLQNKIPAESGEKIVLGFSKQEVSFVAKINELHQENTELARELRKWENEAATELERRQMAEREVSRLKVILELHMDNEKLENHVSEWKSIAEESQSGTVRHCREIHKIFTNLEEVKSELACTCIEKHHR